MACGNCQREQQITLVVGGSSCNYCEKHRAECEARHILAMPSIQARRDYLASVLQRRGAKHHAALADLVRVVWAHNRRP